jgi:hypothetical protein
MRTGRNSDDRDVCTSKRDQLVHDMLPVAERKAGADFVPVAQTYLPSSIRSFPSELGDLQLENGQELN